MIKQLFLQKISTTRRKGGREVNEKCRSGVVREGGSMKMAGKRVVRFMDGPHCITLIFQGDHYIVKYYIIL